MSDPLTAGTLSACHHPARDLHIHVLRLINVTESLKFPCVFLNCLEKGTQAEADMNLYSSLRVSVVTGEQREYISPLLCHYGAPVQHSGSGAEVVSVCTPPSFQQLQRNGRDTNGAASPQSEPLKNALECSKTMLCVFRPQPAGFGAAKTSQSHLNKSQTYRRNSG